MALLKGLILYTLLLLSSVVLQSEAGRFPEVDHQAYRVLGHPETDPGRDDSGGGGDRSVAYWPHHQYLPPMRVNKSTRQFKSVTSGRKNQVDGQHQQAFIKRFSSNTSSNNIISNNNNSDVHCIQAPDNLQQICSATLGWSSRMRLPNFLGHKSYEELSNELTSMNNLLTGVNVIECKALEQFKLLLCATLSPICIDIVVPPCKNLCLRAKASCRPALQLQGLDWPKSLDCRRFPSAPEVCISRQPVFSNQHASQSNSTSATTAIVVAKDDVDHATGQNLDAQSDRLEDRRSVGKTQANANVNATAAATTTTASSISNTKRRRKEKKDRRVKAKATTTTTIAPSPSEPIDTTTQPSPPITNGSNDTVVAPDNSTDNGSSIEVTTGLSSAGAVGRIETDNATSATTSSDSSNLSPYAQSSSPSTLANNIVQVSTTTTTTTTTVSPTPTQTTQTISSTESLSTSQLNSLTSAPSQSSATASTTLTQDLTQYLCSNLPDWLIKTKLTDSQLMSATKKRKLRIRSYRQIFGHSLSVSPSLLNKSTVSRGSPSATTTGASGKTAASSSLIVNLSYSTKFIYPIGADLCTQPMSESPQSQSSSAPLLDGALSHSSSSSVPAAEALIKSSSKTYLIFGVNSLPTTTADSGNVNIKRLATFVVLWPGAKFNKGLDSQANSHIVKTYRDFKTRGASICHQQTTASPLKYAFDST